MFAGRASDIFEPYADEDFEAVLVIWQNVSGGTPTLEQCRNIATPLRNITVLRDPGDNLRPAGMAARHTHYVLSRGNRVEHRQDFRDNTFQPVLDQILGR